MYIIICLVFLLLAGFIYFRSIKAIKSHKTDKISKNYSYFAIYISLWALLPSFIIFFIGSHFSNNMLQKALISNAFSNQSEIVREVATAEVLAIANELKATGVVNVSHSIEGIEDSFLIELAQQYIHYSNISLIAFIAFVVILVSLTFFFMLKRVDLSSNFQRKIEKFVKNILLLFTSIAVLTTIGIVVSLLFETLRFFSDISIINFLFGTSWTPENADFDPENSFGIIPLLSGTFLIAFISVFIASCFGVASAVYMSEYMSKKMRKVIKPLIEILAGIPSIIYGFFAALTFAPFLVSIVDSVFNLTISSESALNAGIVMGVMIIPLISSISDDIISSLPNSMREGAMGMGSMKNEMIRKILLPAAMPGIIGSILLGISRAVGETMIVVMAASLAANLTLNPLEPVTTITTQIVMLVQGDQEFNSPKTLSAFALGFVLLILTLLLNIIAIQIVNRYKRKYQ
ncbi:MAG: phosphate ABC transporter permease subunit PstC [Alphaproteobacteria bacterium]|jgi:phosphate transport system permease protein|nr:phosphate ABC transporter permease subunit PstC [Alphaproteobacteria bacterium]